MRTHKPVPEVAGELEQMGVTTYRAAANPVNQLVIDVMGNLFTVRVKNYEHQPNHHALQLKFTQEERDADPDLYAFYRDGVYLVTGEEAPRRSMSFTLKSHHEIDHAGNRKQANFITDYKAGEFISRVMEGEAL